MLAIYRQILLLPDRITLSGITNKLGLFRVSPLFKAGTGRVGRIKSSELSLIYSDSDVSLRNTRKFSGEMILQLTPNISLSFCRE